MLRLLLAPELPPHPRARLELGVPIHDPVQLVRRRAHDGAPEGLAGRERRALGSPLALELRRAEAELQDVEWQGRPVALAIVVSDPQAGQLLMLLGLHYVLLVLGG